MKRLMCLLVAVILSLSAGAQKLTYLNLEAGPYWSMVKVTDPGNFFGSATVSSAIAGGTIEQEVWRDLYVGTGLYFLPSKTGINMLDRRRHQPRNDSHTALMIPVRFRYRIQPTEYPVSFSPAVGYIYSINREPSGRFSNRGIISAPDGPALSYVQDQGFEEPGSHLLELGLDVGLRFVGLWEASVKVSYISGVLNQAVPSFSLDYSDGQGNDRTAVYETRGNGLYTSLTFRAPVSNLWQNRDYRIRSRIENSLYEGKTVDRKGSFYLGGELGALWRLFHTSNPALGARPMEGRGLFRYANLHTGIYAGYMLTDELGLDLGVNYQRSNYFYAVMIDHEVDFTGKAPAPLYLDIPLRIRYFYDVYKEQVYAMVYGGISMLSQFSSGESPGPGGAFSYTEPAGQSQVTGNAASTVSRLATIRPVLRLGVGAEYRIPIKFPLYATATVNYMQGFMSTEQVLITIDDGTDAGSVTYNGSGWSLDIGARIPFAFDDRENCVRLTRRKKIREN